MILSVMKHTQSTVKFWFIENFLSPTFIVSPSSIPVSLESVLRQHFYRLSSPISPKSMDLSMNW